MKYRLIQMVEGQMVKSEFQDVYAAMEARGFEMIGLNNNHRQRAELQEQPIFKGVMGPFWDGDAVRYECEETFARLSA